MKRTLILLFSFLVSVHAALYAQADADMSKIHPLLWDQLEGNEEEFFPVNILLSDYLDMIEMNENFNKLGTSLEDRSYIVITSLKNKAAATQGPLMNYLNNSAFVDIASIQPYWITNMVYANLQPYAIKELSQREDIGYLELVIQPQIEDMEDARPAPARSFNVPGGHEPGHNAVNAPAMWALGYTGANRKAMIIDSGVDGDHPSLIRNYWGRVVGDSEAWFDTQNSPEPFDCDDHGSAVTGCVLGLNRDTNDTIGIAFNAYWMASPSISGNTGGGCAFRLINDAILAMQWALDPDGNPSTIDDRPDVVNNSWGGDSTSINPAFCNSSDINAVSALEAAGIGVITSAGNLGADIPPPSATSPGYANATLVNAFAVGAINGNVGSYPLASFSSQGPSICGGAGSLLIKPEVVAPGFNVRTSFNGGIYSFISGTSFSSPYVSGVFLLLKEAFPTLTGEQIKMAIYMSATDLGPAGEDNQYGNGLVNAMAAFNYLVGQGHTPVTPNRDKDAMLVSVEQQGEGVCDSVVIPEITVRNNGDTDISSMDIDYDISGGTSGTFTWTGTISPGQNATILFPIIPLPVGYYQIDVDIVSVDGVTDGAVLDNQGQGFFGVFGDDSPTSSPVNVCNGSEGMLTVSSPNPKAEFRWYQTANSTTPLGSGPNFITPTLTSNTSYYVAAVNSFNLGLEDNQTGQGLFVPQITSYLVFDVNYRVLLKSVKVYAGAAGTRTISIKASNGSILGSRIVNLVAGEQVVNLDLFIDPGKNYQIGLAGSLGNLYSTVNGFSFPYDYNGLVTITGSNNSLYHHFYDWELEYESPCDRAFTFATVSNGNAVAAFTASDTVIDISNAQSVKFSNASSGANSYIWSFGDGATSTLENPSHNYTAPGLYRVGLSAQGTDFCSDAFSATVRVIGTYPYNVGVEDELAQFGNIQVFPNPSTGKFNVLMELNGRYEVEMEVFDLLGKRVFNQERESFTQTRKEINLANQSDGIYYLKMTLDGKSVVRKLIKGND